MPKQIIFEGSAVQPDTREFFMKMAKLAYDDELNVTLSEQRPQQVEDYGSGRLGHQEGALNLCIWKEAEITFKVDDSKKA